MLGYFMVGVEMIAEQIEDPFGTDPDDIGLDHLCQVIEQSVTAILSDSSLEPSVFLRSTGTAEASHLPS